MRTNEQNNTNKRSRVLILNFSLPPWKCFRLPMVIVFFSLSMSRIRINALSTATPTLTKPIQKPLVKSIEDSEKKVSVTTADITLRPRSYKIGRSYNSALSALRIYKSIHGDLAMPRRFVIPHNSDVYPEEWHGVDLSNTVYDMKWWQNNVAKHPKRVAELNDLGFVWGRLQPEWNIVLEALITYSCLNDGSLLIPSSFVVPHGDKNWSMSTWGLSLGNCVHRIRTRHDYVRSHPDRFTQLDNMNFIWDVSEINFVKFFKALSCYARIEFGVNGSFSRKRAVSLRVPSTFVVPCNHDVWPKDLWGYPLGAKCGAVRHKQLYIKNHPDRREALENVGFIFGPNSTTGWLQVIHAAAIYSNIHGRTLDVPQKFKVPFPPEDMQYAEGYCEELWPWPEHLWGLPLGQRLRDVRLRGRYLSGGSGDLRRSQLNALGFNWKPKRGRRKQQQTIPSS